MSFLESPTIADPVQPSVLTDFFVFLFIFLFLIFITSSYIATLSSVADWWIIC